MANAVEQVVVNVTADTSDSAKKIADLQRQVAIMSNSVQKNASDAAGGFTVMKGAIAGVVSNLATKAFSMAADGLHDVWAGAQNTGASLSTLKTVLGTLDLGQYYSEWSKFAQTYAQQTVFSTADITNAIGQLAATGKISAQGLTPLIKGLGGLAAATDNPKNAMNALLYVMPQINSLGKLQAQDWNQVRNAIGGMAAQVQKYIMTKNGITDWNKAMSEGKISAQMVDDAITAVGNNGGLQRMATTPKTVSQAFDGLSESVSNAMQNPSNEINQILVPAIGKLADKISSTDWSFLAKGLDAAVKIAGDPVFQSFAIGLGAAAVAMWGLSAAQAAYNVLAATGNALMAVGLFALLAVVAGVIYFFTQTKQGQAIFAQIMGAFQALWVYAQGFFDAIGIIVGTLTNMIWSFFSGMIGMISGAVSGLAGAIIGYVQFVYNFYAAVIGAVAAYFKFWMSVIVGAARGAVNGIVGFFNWMAGAIGGVVGGIGNSVRGAFNFILNGVQSGINGVVNFFKGLVNSVISGVNGAIGVINHIPGVHIGLIPKFAKGGIVAGPGNGTSDSVPAMLSAGEYVVRAQAVNAIGVQNLDALNRGVIPAAGGVNVSVNAPQQADPVWLGHEIGRQVVMATSAAAGAV